MKNVPLHILQRWQQNAARIAAMARTMQKEICDSDYDLERQQLLIIATGDAVIGAEETARELAIIIRNKFEHDAAQMELAEAKAQPLSLMGQLCCSVGELEKSTP